MTTYRNSTSHHSLNCGGRLFSLAEPQVMGILNVTPDSFFSDSRQQTEAEVEARVRCIIEEGASMIDIGACSTRPGATPVEAEEEVARLRMALPIVKRCAPDAVISVDTFRADIARMCVEELGAHIINDISAGEADTAMLKTVARLGVPYVLTHNAANALGEDPVREVFLDLAARIRRLRDLGAKDIILDPGFGFGKTLEENYALMAVLEEFAEFRLPLLVGVSRKSMIHRLLDCTPEEALNGTTALHAVALMKGADILRVHDVKAAMETLKICRLCHL